MKFVKTLVAVTVTVCAMNANAGLTFAQASAMGVSGGPLPLTALSGVGTLANVTGSIVNQRTTPMGLGVSDAYSVISTGGSALLSFSSAVSGYSFLWGSPDDGNSIEIATNNVGTVTYTGTQFKSAGGFLVDGVNANTRLFNIGTNSGTLINSITFKSSNIAFEVATAPIPEPETYVLMLAGLGAMGFIARRRRSAQASV